MPRRESELQLPWSVIYYQALHGSVPAIDFLSSHPGKVEGEFAAVLEAVAAPPPPASPAAANEKPCAAR
jgi:hypothetical protein